MLQVWKIEVPSDQGDDSIVHGWALAETAEEAKALSGREDSVVQKKVEHLWIAKERVVWETQSKPR